MIRSQMTPPYNDDCPIIVDGENICEIAEKLDFVIGKPLEKLSMEKKISISKRIEPNENKQKILVNNKRLLSKAITQFVRKECFCSVSFQQ